jgi:hypothetical protein
VRVGQQTAAIFVSEKGREVLKAAAVDIQESLAVMLFVQDSDDLGLWVRVNRADGEHMLLIRWEFILSLDITVGETKTIGLKA